MVSFVDMNAAVIGTGFMGAMHSQMLRRLGITVRGVLGSSHERGQERAIELGVKHAYQDLDELLADEQVSIVHITSPNHAHFEQVLAVLNAGKHVVCEKPLSMDSAQSAEMVKVAKASGKIAAVSYNIRFYPLNQQAQGMIADQAIGNVRFVTGHYHQDWLAKSTDWNWRLDTELGGALRSVSDIGTHWTDLTSYITGQKVTAVMAELSTFLPKRQKPTVPSGTFSAAQGATKATDIITDDSAIIMLRFENGARGVLTTSQINFGRKNSVKWDITGSTASVAWDSENPDKLFVGHRDKANETLMRDFTLMNEKGVAAATLPPGHVEGYADSFYAFFRAVYTDIAAGERGVDSTWATFDDGHYEMKICDAILCSAEQGRWVELSEL